MSSTLQLDSLHSEQLDLQLDSLHSEPPEKPMNTGVGNKGPSSQGYGFSCG